MSLALLYSRIVDSGNLASRLGVMYQGVLSKHHEMIKSLLLPYDCQLVELKNDTAFITFTNPEQAVRAAIDFQQYICNYQWPNQETVTLGIGLHWGLHQFSDFTISNDLKLTIEICEKAQGKQVLISQALLDNLKGKLVQDLKVHPIGNIALKGFTDEITLHHVEIPGINPAYPDAEAKKGPPSIAVLPFHNLDSDSRDDYLGLGIAEEIINALGKNPEIKVIARATTFGVNPMLKVKALGSLLHASVILDGTVKREGEMISISVELTDIDSGDDLWVKEFCRQADEIMAIQDEITSTLLTILLAKEDQEVSSEIQEVQTENAEAYDAYLRGNRFYYQFSLQSIQFARRMFQQALQLDRHYALAYCGLANCFSYLFMHYVRSDENLVKAQDYSKKAIEMNPTLAAPYAAHGLALSLNGQFSESEAAFEKAISLDPLLFEGIYQYARMEFSRGNLEKSAGLFDRASHIRQDDYQTLLLMGQCYDSLGKASDAVFTRQRGVEIAEEVLQLNPGDVRALYMGANGLAALGGEENIQKAIGWLKRAFTLDPKDPMLLYNAGCIYSLCKMKDQALNCLEQAVQHGLTQKAWYEHDSNLDALRNDKRFQKLLSKL